MYRQLFSEAEVVEDKTEEHHSSTAGVAVGAAKSRRQYQ